MARGAQYAAAIVLLSIVLGGIVLWRWGNRTLIEAKYEPPYEYPPLTPAEIDEQVAAFGTDPEYAGEWP